MTSEFLGEQSRFLYYALLISRAYSALVDYRESRSLTPAAVEALKGALDHLEQANAAKQLVAPRDRRIAPDLERVQIFQCVWQATSRAQGEVSLSDVSFSIDGVVKVLKAVLASEPLPDAGEEPFAYAERVLDLLASCYRNRAEGNQHSKDFEDLLQCRSLLRLQA